MAQRVLASSGCYDGDCPTFWVDDATGVVTIRGYSTRRRMFAALRRGRPEDDVTIPGPVFTHLAPSCRGDRRRLRRALRPVHPHGVPHECRQAYAVPAEDPSARAFREGLPRPERSVRTSAWLRRIAVTTAQGKDWSRLRLIEWPLTEYTRHELLSYVESQAAGERILLVDRAHVDYDGPDYWLFDDGTEHARAGLLHYSHAGEMKRRELVTEAARTAELAAVRDRALRHAVPLNTFLATVDGRCRA